MSAEQTRGMDGEGERVSQEDVGDASDTSPVSDQPSAEEPSVLLAPPASPTGVARPTPEAVPRVVWLTAASRAAALWSVVGAALAFSAQLAFRTRGVSRLIRENDLSEEVRGALLKSLVAGAAAGIVAALLLSWFLWRRRRPVADVDRIAWFAAPLGLLGFLPVLFRRKPWDQDLALLVTIAVFALIVQGTFVRSLGVTPVPLLRGLRWLRDKVPARLREHAPTVVVALASLAFAVLIGRYAIIRHHSLESGTFDLGISDNLAYNALSGKLRSPAFTGNRADGPSILSGHAQFGVFLLAPFYAIRPSSETLIVIQTSLVALGAVLLYVFARRRLSGWVSACVAVTYLANPAVQGAAMYEMTYLPVAAVFVLGTAWALDAGRFIPFVLFAACAMSMREDIPIGLCIMGIAYALSGRRLLMGAVLAVAGALYFGIVRLYFMEKWGGWNFPTLMYGELVPAGAKASFGTVIKTLITNPFFALKKLLVEQKLVYVLHLLVPLALLPLRRPWLLVALVPGALLTLTTTNYSPTVSLGFQYVMHWMPYLFLAVPLALAAILAERDGAVKMRAALLALLAATVVHTYQYGAFGSDKFRVGFFTFKASNYDQAKRERYAQLISLIKDLPPDAPIAATGRVGPHLTNRKEAYVTDDLGFQDAEFVVFWKADLYTTNNRAHIIDALTHIKYGIQDIKGDFVLFKKGYDTSRNAWLLKEWALE